MTTSCSSEDSVPLAPRPPAPYWATVIATFFGTGRLRPGPGSWGSAATVLLWWILTRWIPPNWQPWAAFLLAGLAVLVGVSPASRGAGATAPKNPPLGGIDQAAAQPILLVAAPLCWDTSVLA